MDYHHFFKKIKQMNLVVYGHYFQLSKKM